MESIPSAEGPDFLCIGMGKSGTGWIYDQCQRHPDFWMPPIRELHYLDHEYPRRTPRKLERIRSVEHRQALRQKRAMRLLEDRDFVFAEEMKAVKGQPMDLERYAAMFRFKGNKLSGDVTPSYCTMPEERIARVMARFPHLRIFLMIRDPVSRAWSHFSMKHRGDKIGTVALREPDKFREMLRNSKVTRMGSPANVHRNWSRYVDPLMLRCYFFEDLTADAEAVSADVLGFLGCDPSKNPVDATLNRKAEKPKLEMTAEIRDILVEQFAGEIADCARYFGGHAQSWATKYGIETTSPTGPAEALPS